MSPTETTPAIPAVTVPKPDKRFLTSRVLRVTYTDSERLNLGRTLAEAHGQLTQINSDFDMVKGSFKAKLTAKEAEIADLATKVSTGFRLETVPCVWEIDSPKVGMKVLRRGDNPIEIVETTNMSESDKQVELPLTEMAEKLNAALPVGVTATLTPTGAIVHDTPKLAGVAGDGNVTVAADKK